MRPLLRIGFLLVLFLPWSAHAAWEMEWGFANETFQQSWQVSGEPALKITKDGMLITTKADSILGRSIEASHPIEVVSIDYKAVVPAEGWLYWHKPGTPAEDLLRIPLYFSKTEGVGTVGINMQEYQKRLYADFIGIGIPAHAEVLIARISLQNWSLSEKTLEAFKSFWTFDMRRPSSVNFLWGPHVVFNPTARKLMFSVTEPIDQSANRYFYIVILLATAWAVWNVHKHPERRAAVCKTLFLLLASLWVLYDLRMGSEFLSYVERDYRTYWSRPLGERTFRERSYFNDFAAGVTPLVQNRDRYIFTAPDRWPYLGLMRYYTFPAVPTHPFQEEHYVDTWAVYKRPDIVQNAKGELESDGIVLTHPGKILHEFELGSFVFRETRQ
ncbi:hypothetical protein COU76_03310 [Candidatus Peregrinibacteria bacterium CG10_big_fil_rev_8_21_14_0_10_49_10]|nr:MAG: hypothetical protein COU76_03310 [Candidatus Peregrinibacteria bacterium CG10_big_fil_rev_8_21_14_0_10_49_10]